jgi:hypothetical protein
MGLRIIDRGEQEEERRWMDLGDEHPWQSLKELVGYAVYGIKTCEDSCESALINEEAACPCLRARFASMDHFFLYLELRQLAKELTAFGLLAQTMKLGEQNDNEQQDSF